MRASRAPAPAILWSRTRANSIRCARSVRELQASVPDGFVIASVGDLIISRPLSQYASRIPAFNAVLERLRKADVTFGNLETTIFDPRSFKGSPYSWEGDWTDASVPAVARDLRAMGFGIVSRANNHALDWGIEGMLEMGPVARRSRNRPCGGG